MISLVDLLAKLVAFESITPADAGCQDFIQTYLTTLGFQCERLDCPPVTNLYAQWGNGKPLFLFAGHTDVVPVGEIGKWHTPPFALHEQNGLLFGRGTADMKGSLACMLRAATKLLSTAHFQGSLGFLITSGEEGDDFLCGTPYVMDILQQRGIHPDYCIVGEPSSQQLLGDMIKVGRRGSLTATVTVQGKQGHVAYPHLAENPIHCVAPALLELTSRQWDQGNAFFPPTSLQVTRLEAGGLAGNVIPGELILQFNFRYSTELSAQTLQEAVLAIFKKHSLKTNITWRHNGEPFLTKNGLLLEKTIQAIEATTGLNPTLSTSGGTSDGRFIAPYGVEVIELGPVNQTIHQVNEHVRLSDLEQLEAIYYQIASALVNKQTVPT